MQIEDPNLTNVSHLLVDEIHERGMNEDFLLIILRDLLPRRPDLRLILMSATINADMFSTYFGNSPTMHIPVCLVVNPVTCLWSDIRDLSLFNLLPGFHISCGRVIPRRCIGEKSL